VSDPDSLSREELLAALAQRDAVIEVLLAEIEQLKRRVGVDSSNSSMPPGSDRPAARAKRAKARRSKPSPRRRGGQAGHEGHSLQRVSDPDLVEVLAPADLVGSTNRRVRSHHSAAPVALVRTYRLHLFPI
jgi:hypothetical protein